MAKIKFHKMVSAGNDFVVIDHRRSKIKGLAAFARDVCRPHFGLGADGVVLLENTPKADLRMRIINADGSEAEMCGNATRCVGLYAHKIMGHGKEITLETRGGMIRTSIRGERVSSEFAEPRDYRALSKISIGGVSYPYYFVNTGVPHTVIFRKDIATFPVFEVGRAIRYHKKFAPKGTNVNFVRVENKHTIRIRTYERGVENETLACGTGSAASAIVSVVEAFCLSPVTVHTKSGERLIVDFDHVGSHVENLTVEGPAKFICEGVFA